MSPLSLRCFEQLSPDFFPEYHAPSGKGSTLKGKCLLPSQATSFPLFQESINSDKVASPESVSIPLKA